MLEPLLVLPFLSLLVGYSANKSHIVINIIVKLFLPQPGHSFYCLFRAADQTNKQIPIKEVFAVQWKKLPHRIHPCILALSSSGSLPSPLSSSTLRHIQGIGTSLMMAVVDWFLGHGGVRTGGRISEQNGKHPETHLALSISLSPPQSNPFCFRYYFRFSSPVFHPSPCRSPSDSGYQFSPQLLFLPKTSYH